jgi:hypothetical protein
LEIQALEEVYIDVNSITTNANDGILKDYFTISEQGVLNRVSGKDDDFVSALQSGSLNEGDKIPNTFRISDVSSIDSYAFYGCAYLSDSSTTPINTLQFNLSSISPLSIAS